MRKRGTILTGPREETLRTKDLRPDRVKIVVYPTVIEPVAKLPQGRLRRIYAIAKKLEA